MPNEDYEPLIDTLPDIISNLTERSPKENQFGLFQYGDAPGGIGGGVGCFLWFTSDEERIEFIKKHAVILNPPPSSGDWDKVDQEVKRVCSSTPLNLDDLNSVLKSYTQFPWIGSFNELLISEEGYPKEVKEFYFDEEDKSLVIPGDDIDDFIEFLTTYGF